MKHLKEELRRRGLPIYWPKERAVGALSCERRLTDVNVAPAAQISKRNLGPHIGWHAEPRKARPQTVTQVTKSAKGQEQSSMKIVPIPYLCIEKRDTGGGVVRGRGKNASLGIHGASYCGDKLTIAQDGGRVHGDNPHHA